jgi:hypothetical protein
MVRMVHRRVQMETFLQSPATKRMGTGSRDLLSWLVAQFEGPPLEEDEWRKLYSNLSTFTMLTAGTPLSGLAAREIDMESLSREAIDKSLTLRAALHKNPWGILYAALDMLEKAANREVFQLANQSEVGRWDSAKHRYVRTVDPLHDNARAATLRGVARCLFEHGHLLMACQAPAKMKPGRKAAGRAEELDATCGRLFVARKQTQRYCSGACLSRIMTRKKRAKAQERSPRRHKRTVTAGRAKVKVARRPRR